MHPEPVTPFELDAYIDGELDRARCLAVEEHLARDPEAAARLMADLSLRSALRLAQPVLHCNASVDDAAARLNQKIGVSERPIANFLSRRKWVGGLAAAAAVAMLVLIPGAPLLQAKPPTYVADAIEAYQTGLLRADMPSQVETPHFDARDVQRFTRIRVPLLPAGWRLTDVQLFPSDDGPALQLMALTPRHQIVSIFAVRTAASAPVQPAIVRKGKTTVAYWRHGDIAYALTGVDAPAALDMAADDLADNQLG